MLRKLTIVTGILYVLALAAAPAYAQNGAVTGTLTDSETGDPLPGANVLIEEINEGAATDAEGNYEIQEIPEGTYIMVASFVGYASEEVEVTIEADETTTVDIELEPSEMALEDVVVTAFGVEREQRSIGYASQGVSTEEMTRVRDNNFVNSLQGKVAGVNITSGSGTLGSSSRILLRGVSSITGENQPLFVVDGVYIDNTNFDPAGEGGGIDFGNAAMDINPDNIESINVLKGANAAALYGSRAANGVIIIETKDGRGMEDGIGVEISSNVNFEDVLVLPDMQNEYGQGSGGQFEFVDGRGGGVNDGVDESWGPPLDEGLEIPQFFSDGEPAPWVSHPDNVKDFFETGAAITNNVALSGNYDQANYRLSVTNTMQDGVMPNNSLDRTNIALNAGAQITDRFRADGRVSYNQNIINNRPGVGYSAANPMQQLTQWFGRQVDIDRLRDYETEEGGPFNWNYNYHDNPFWLQYENTNRQQRDRVTGQIELNYDFADWLSLTARTGSDFYNDRRNIRAAVGTLNDPDGFYEEDLYFVNEWTSTALLRANRDLASGINLDLRTGLERVDQNWEQNSGIADALSTPGVYTLENSAVRPQLHDFTSKKRLNSIFAAATFGYNDYIYLDLNARNDWSSTLPDDNNSYFYPGASISFIPSDAFEIDAPWLTYTKLRASFAQVGNDTDPYQLQPYFDFGPEFGLAVAPTYTVQNTIPNPELKPERTNAWEVGGEIRFLDNRLGLDLTYYDERTFDQIIPLQISRASGYAEQVINAGEMSNKGWEVEINTTPAQTTNVQWNLDLNWAKNNNEIVELAEGLNTILLEDTWDVTVEARPGEEFGTLRGTGFARDDDGNIIVDSDGIPIIDSEIQNFGSYQPDWTGSIRNTVSYRNLGLSFLIDVNQGGKISSVTYMFGRYTGILEETAEGREDGYVFDGGRWADGAVTEDGEPNDIAANAELFNKLTFFGNAESHIFDASYTKLREARLTYSLPPRMFENSFIRTIDLSVVGRNLWIISKDAPHIDPETAYNSGNVQGLESNQHPSVRRIGFNVNIAL